MNEQRLHLSCASWTGVVAAALVTILSTGHAAEPSWTVKFDFNDGTVGQMVPGLGAAGRTRFTTEQSFEGGKAVSLEARRGRESFGRWGGTVKFPARLRKGDEIWWRVRTFWPKGMDYSANPRLKFLRVHTCTPQGKNRGYNDIYINAPGSKIPFQFIYEGAHKWKPVSGAADAIVPDKWETYEYYLKLDDKSVADGGKARVRFWKDGKLLKDVTDRKTLKDPKDYANAAFLFTYWNSSPYMGQITYDEGGPFQQGEMVECSKHPDVKFRVMKATQGAVYLQDPTRDWRKRTRPWGVLKVGEKITGLTSKKTCIVKEILHSHPVMDIKMYVDDMVITCKEPKGRDAQGNPCIGMGPKRSQDEGLPEPKGAGKAIFFQDGFESGNMSATNPDGFKWANNNGTYVATAEKKVWYNGPADQPAKEGEDWKPKSGKHSFLFVYKPGKDHWTEQRFRLGKAQRDLWIRYWLRVPTNFSHGTRRPTNNKLFALWMDGYSQKGDGPTIAWEFWNDGKNGSKLAVHFSEGGHRSCGGHKQHKPFVSLADRGRWMEMVLHVKAATSRTSKDGVIQTWRRWDGEKAFTKLHEILDANIAAPPGGPDGWERGYVMGWSNPNYDEETVWQVDDFTLSAESLLATGRGASAAGANEEAIFFQDGFESGDMSKTNPDGFKWANNNRTSVVTAEKAVWNNRKIANPIPDGCDWKAKTGKHCLRFSYPPGQPWAEQRFDLGKPYKELWMRYWLRVPKNYVHEAKSPNNGKFLSVWMDKYSGKGDGSTVWWGLWLNGKGNSNVAACYNRGGHTGTLGYKQYKRFISVPADCGRWMLVVFRIKAASDRASKDGVMQMWRRWENEPTFTKFTDITDADIAPPPGGPQGWQRGYILGWMNAKFKERTEFLLDDFALSTESLLATATEARRSREAGLPAPKASALSDGERRQNSAEQEAGRIFQMARRAERMGQREVARSLFERIVEKYPDTEAGKAAAKKR